jgi:hypothetical protein
MLAGCGEGLAEIMLAGVPTHQAGAGPSGAGGASLHVKIRNNSVARFQRPTLRFAGDVVRGTTHLRQSQTGAHTRGSEAL